MNRTLSSSRPLRWLITMGLLIALCFSNPATIAAFAPTQPGNQPPVTALAMPVTEELPVPVAADTIYTVDLPASQDTHIIQNQRNVNFGNCNVLHTRDPKPIEGSVSQENRALIQFDLSGIPAGASILTATMQLYQYGVSDDATVTAYRITNAWTEGSGACSGVSGSASWDSRQSGVNWTTVGGDYDPAAIAVQLVADTGFYSWQVTAQVSRWIAGTQPNYGLLLVQTISGRVVKVWYSRTWGTVNQRPILRVYYTLPPQLNITSLALYQPDHTTPATNMNPQIEYAIQVGVAYNIALSNLSRITATLFFDSDGDHSPATVPKTSNTQAVAILVWKPGASPNWTIDPASNTTWSLVSSNCVSPNLGATSGIFWFHVKPGKVATQAAAWNLYAEVLSSSGLAATSYDAASYAMNWYGEIIVGTPIIDWGRVTLGSDFTANIQSGIVITYISNSAFKEQIKTDGTWVSPAAVVTLNSAGAPGNAQFSVKAYPANTYASAILLTTAYQTLKSGTQTAEAGQLESTNTLWLRLGPTGMPVAVYSGPIYFYISP